MAKNKGECLQRVSLRLSYDSITALGQYLNLWLPYSLGVGAYRYYTSYTWEAGDWWVREGEKKRWKKLMRQTFLFFYRKLISLYSWVKSYFPCIHECLSGLSVVLFHCSVFLTVRENVWNTFIIFSSFCFRPLECVLQIARKIALT